MLLMLAPLVFCFVFFHFRLYGLSKMRQSGFLLKNIKI